jgi:23S rRNA (cytidine1920-2'-O)/16S rRNA (cytidine1409-2'-O)-methyltransferase
MEADSLVDKIDVATIDVAFISLDKILPAAKNILAADGAVIALIKPQFEAGKENVGKKGVVRDAKIHAEVIRKILSVARNEGLIPAGLDYSPIKGPEGNIEFLLYLTMQGEDQVDENKVNQVVAASHGEL